MTVQWTLYNETTGAVISRGDAMDEEQARLQATGGGRIVLVNLDPDTQIVNPGTGVPAPRPPMSVNGVLTAANRTNMAANGTEAVIVSSIPNGATYNMVVPEDKGITLIPDATISDGQLIITTTVAGKYVLTLRSGNYLDFKVTINAA